MRIYGHVGVHRSQAHALPPTYKSNLIGSRHPRAAGIHLLKATITSWIVAHDDCYSYIEILFLAY
jgi:hypothetical protein